MSSIFPLFSSPVMVCSKNYEFNESESQFIADLEMFDNVGNLMSKDDEILERVQLQGLRRFIDTEIAKYKKSLLRMKEENEIYITQSWANRSSTDKFHPKHKHPNSIISGVLFCNGAEEDKLPPIRFHRSQELFPLEFQYDELNEFNSGMRWFEPVKGRLILFPSLLEHDVGPNESTIERTTLSFNTFVRGDLGSNTSLTKVKLA